MQCLLYIHLGSKLGLNQELSLCSKLIFSMFYIFATFEIPNIVAEFIV